MKQRATFGNLAIVFFLLMQAADGVLSYIGISVCDVAMEGNPFVASIMTYAGNGPGLIVAKSWAGALGIWLHLLRANMVVFVLALLYLCVTTAPWIYLIYFY